MLIGILPSALKRLSWPHPGRHFVLVGSPGGPEREAGLLGAVHPCLLLVSAGLLPGLKALSITFPPLHRQTPSLGTPAMHPSFLVHPPPRPRAPCFLLRLEHYRGSVRSRSAGGPGPHSGARGWVAGAQRAHLPFHPKRGHQTVCKGVLSSGPLGLLRAPDNDPGLLKLPIPTNPCRRGRQSPFVLKVLWG